jgi:hypothetical protein
MLFTALFYWRVLKKTILSLVLITLIKNPRTRKFESVHEEHYVERKNDGIKPDKNSSLEDSSLRPETSTKNAFQEFHLSISPILEHTEIVILILQTL